MTLDQPRIRIALCHVGIQYTWLRMGHVNKLDLKLFHAVGDGQNV